MATAAALEPSPTAPAFQPETANLYCQEGSSDKVYHLQLAQSEAGWTVFVQRGRRGSSLISEAKCEGVDYTQAKRQYDKLKREKLSHNYRDPDANAPRQEIFEQTLTSHDAPAPKKAAASAPMTKSRGAFGMDIVFQPELLTRCTEQEADRYARDDRYLFQPKQDGDRLALVLKNDGKSELVTGLNRLGQIVAIDHRLDGAIRRLAGDPGIDSLFLDGELEADGFHPWDVLDCRYDLRWNPYGDRLQVLDTLFTSPCAEIAQWIHPIRNAYGTERKLALLADRTLEGVAIKRIDAAFRPGRNGQHKKFKFEQTASFIVGPKPPAKINDGHRSVALYLYDAANPDLMLDGVLPVTYVSTVKVADRYPIPEAKSVVEVRYLYAYPGGGIAQPVYFGKIRSDVRRQDCTPAQLKLKSGSPEE